MTLPSIIPLRVSICAGCPIMMSRVCISAMRTSAFRREGSTTRARFVPCVTCYPSWMATSCTTPFTPARTFNAGKIVAQTFQFACWRQVPGKQRKFFAQFGWFLRWIRDVIAQSGKIALHPPKRQGFRPPITVLALCALCLYTARAGVIRFPHVSGNISLSLKAAFRCALPLFLRPLLFSRCHWKSRAIRNVFSRRLCRCPVRRAVRGSVAPLNRLLC